MNTKSESFLKPVLVIGTTCVDNILTLDHLPVTEEDLNPSSQTITVGGCAYNTANIIRQAGVPVTLASPVGRGIYGDFVAKHLTDNGFPIFKRTAEENGCCYCLVEKSGERTFLSYHGIEYSFHREWMKDIRLSDYGYVYVCGLEIEETTGEELVEYLEDEFKNIKDDSTVLFFSPSPRVGAIDKDRVRRLLALSPILHINRRELEILSDTSSLTDGCRLIHDITHMPIFVTRGGKGAYCLDKDGIEHAAPAYPAKVVDTIGAGDSHAGQLLAELTKGHSIDLAMKNANLVSSHVIGIKGASLSDDEYKKIFS